MTDQERIKRLAEWMGWEVTMTPLRDWYARTSPNGDGVWLPIEWNPLERIQDCGPLKAELIRKGFRLELLISIHGTACDILLESDPDAIIEHTFADTECKAICKAVEKLMEESIRQPVPTSGDVEA